MSLRLVEVTVPSGSIEEVRDVLEESEAMDVWAVEEEGERGVVRVLVRSDAAEGITDRLSERFEGREGFRLLLFTVEATVPPEDEDDEEEGRKDEREGPLRVSREELYQDLADGSRITVVYLVTVALSAVVAAVGLIRNDVAVIIGAMVIAPLLAPNVALSLAATLGDLKLGRQAGLASLAGAGAALAVSVALGAFVPFDPATPQLLARSRVGLGDAALGLAAGSAGALAYTTGLPAAVIGVMVAVALLPPLVATGLLLGGGYVTMAAGAAILTFTNLTAINLAGVVTFLAQRVRPRTWWEEERAKKATRAALVAWVGLFAVLVALMLWVVGDPNPGAKVTDEGGEADSAGEAAGAGGAPTISDEQSSPEPVGADSVRPRPDGGR